MTRAPRYLLCGSQVAKMPPSQTEGDREREFGYGLKAFKQSLSPENSDQNGVMQEEEKWIIKRMEMVQKLSFAN